MPTQTPDSGNQSIKPAGLTTDYDSDIEENGWRLALSKGMRKRMKALNMEVTDFQKVPADVMVDWKTLSFPPDDSPSTLRAKFDSAFNKFLHPSSIEMLNIQMVRSILEHLRNNQRIFKTSSPATFLCLGLGNPALYASSLNQLALLTALVRLSEGAFLPEKTFIYDPLMKKVARDFIRGLGFRILSFNFEGQYRLPRDKAVFVFLPFTPAALAENLIATNFDKGVLNRLTFLSNPIIPRPDSSGLPTTPHVSLLQPYRRFAKINTKDRDFRALQVEWFDIPPEVKLEKILENNAYSPLITPFHKVKSFVDGEDDGETLDQLS
nr:protein sensitivity to red light reduced [Hymenolepis microstoma]